MLRSRRMSQTLQDILAEFVGKPPGSVEVAVIHPRQEMGRLGGMLAMEAALKHPIEVFEAVSGRPMKYAMAPSETRSAEEVGMLASHAGLLQRALKEGVSYVLVFEDVCIPAPSFSLAGLQAYMRRAKEFSREFSFVGADEFLLLGTTGCYTWKKLTEGVKATDKFNGSHCYLIGRPMMEKFLEAYDHMLGMGVAVPTDEFLGVLLRSQGRWALCPEEDHFVTQRRAS